MEHVRARAQVPRRVESPLTKAFRRRQGLKPRALRRAALLRSRAFKQTLTATTTMLRSGRFRRSQVACGHGRATRDKGGRSLVTLSRHRFTGVALAAALVAATIVVSPPPAAAHTAREACGSGYSPVAKPRAIKTDSGVRYGKVHLLYNSGNGKNCVVAIKERFHGIKTHADAYLKVRATPDHGTAGGAITATSTTTRGATPAPPSSTRPTSACSSSGASTVSRPLMASAPWPKAAGPSGGTAAAE
jgi:hypothetical protein